MRVLSFLVALCVVAACSGGGGGDETPTTAPHSTTSTSAASTTTTGPIAPPVIAAVGDSNLFESEDELRASLLSFDVQVHAVIGLKTGEGHFGFQEVTAERPPALIVVLGTNDALDDTITEDELAGLEALAQRVVSVPCVQWADVSTSGASPRYNVAAVRWNDALREASLRHGFDVIPWSAALGGHPEWLRSDGIHLTDEGQEAFAAMLAEAATGCLATLPLDQLRP